jgi:surface antigen
MATTLDGARLKQITVSGTKVSASLAGACVAASLSLSNSQVTEMSLAFQDSADADLFTSKLFARGATIRYGDWFFVADGVEFGPGSAGPLLKVTAPSKFVTALRKQTGAKSWGTTPVSAWVTSVAASVGMKSLVQPGLGSKAIARQAPVKGQPPENTWDVLTQIARETGVWLFEYGSTLVFAKPSHLVKATWPRRTWALVWHDWFNYSGGLTGMPVYKDDPSAELPESMTVRLVSADADQARPGDAVVLSGRNVGPMVGTWIVNAVDFPLRVADAVTLTCQRPIDPAIEPPRQDTAPAATSASKTSSSSSGGGGSAPVSAGVASAVDRWVNSVNGRAIDMDGAYGAQCVDLANHYHINVVGGGGQVFANGNQWFNNAPASLYSKYPVYAANGESAGKGDIACWNAFYGGGYGHVAIVLADLGGSLRVMTQNPGPANITTLSKQGLQGYLRPKRVG